MHRLGSSVTNAVKGPDVRESPETPPGIDRTNQGSSISELEADLQPQATVFAQNFRQSIISRYHQGKDLNLPFDDPSANATTPILTMATLATASRLCLRSAAKPAVPAVRALSTTAMRPDSATASGYSSPFRGETKGSKIPDFGAYVSKNGENRNKLYSYFMVGALGAVSAAGAKSTVQGG